MDASRDEGWRGDRRGRLLDAASRVFSRLSYEHASMDEIAHEAGVGKPTLYRYFASKDALFTAVFVEALETLEHRLLAVLARPGTFDERLVRLVATIIPTFRDHLVSVGVLGHDAAAVDASKRTIFRERRTRIARCLARAVEDASAAGDVRPGVDPMRTAHVMIGMIWSAAAAIEAGDDEIAQDVSALILHGVARRRDPVPVRADDEGRNGHFHPINDSRIAKGRPRGAASS